MLHWCFSWDLNVWSSYIRGGFGFQDALGYTQLDPNSVSVLFSTNSCVTGCKIKNNREQYHYTESLQQPEIHRMKDKKPQKKDTKEIKVCNPLYN